MTTRFLLVSLSRWFVGLGYLAALCLVIFLVVDRSCVSTFIVAARDLPVNHRLQLDDLRPGVAVVGQHLGKPVKQGEEITASVVQRQPSLTGPSNSIVALIAVPETTVQGLKLDVGNNVQICRSGQPFAPPSKVFSVECKDQKCSIMVTLPKMPAQIVDPDALVGATIIAPTPQPSCPK